MGGRPPQAPTPGPRKLVNFTDEESRIMPSTEGFVQGYNAQAAVDVDSHMVVTNHVTAHCNDKQEVAPMAVGRVARCRWEAGWVVGGCGLFQPG